MSLGNRTGRRQRAGPPVVLTIGLVAALLIGCGDASDNAGEEPSGTPAARAAEPGRDSAGVRDPSGAVDPPVPADTAVPMDTAAAPGSVSTPGPSPASAEGGDLLDRASAAYEGLRSMQADFVMRLENPLLRRTTTSRGTLFQRMPDRILLRFSEPDGDVIVGDGRYFWVYYPSVNPDQVTRAPAAQAGSGGVDLRAQFVGNPRERFDWTVDGEEEVDGRRAVAISLVPKEPAGYRGLKVWIDREDALVRRFEISEHNGATRGFEFASLRVNPTLPDSLFVFDPPPGVRVVDAPGSN